MEEGGKIMKKIIVETRVTIDKFSKDPAQWNVYVSTLVET